MKSEFAAVASLPAGAAATTEKCWRGVLRRSASAARSPGRLAVDGAVHGGNALGEFLADDRTQRSLPFPQVQRGADQLRQHQPARHEQRQAAEQAARQQPHRSASTPAAST
jgi:hypothetical protein